MFGEAAAELLIRIGIIDDTKGDLASMEAALDKVCDAAERGLGGMDKSSKELRTEWKSAVRDVSLLGHGVMSMGLVMTNTAMILTQMGVISEDFGQSLALAGGLATSLGGAISTVVPMLQAFGIAINSALGWIGLLLIAVTALVAAMAILNDKSKSSKKEIEEMGKEVEFLNLAVQVSSHAFTDEQRALGKLVTLQKEYTDATAALNEAYERREDLARDVALAELDILDIMDSMEDKEKELAELQDQLSGKGELEKGSKVVMTPEGPKHVGLSGTEREDAEERVSDLQRALERERVQLEQAKDRREDLKKEAEELPGKITELETRVDKLHGKMVALGYETPAAMATAIDMMTANLDATEATLLKWQDDLHHKQVALAEEKLFAPLEEKSTAAGKEAMDRMFGPGWEERVQQSDVSLQYAAGLSFPEGSPEAQKKAAQTVIGPVTYNDTVNIEQLILSPEYSYEDFMSDRNESVARARKKLGLV